MVHLAVVGGCLLFRTSADAVAGWRIVCCGSSHGNSLGPIVFCTAKNAVKNPPPVFRFVGDGVGNAQEDAPCPCDAVGSVPKDWSNAADGVRSVREDSPCSGDGVARGVTDKSGEGFAIFRRKMPFCCAGADCFHRGHRKAQTADKALA